jgi:prepilin-type N-terminal cleavage/methylation domain-containing protein
MTAFLKKFKDDGVSGGFTLIELLIVMAILGVLAVVVLVAINPVQQLARTRDTGRKSSVTQLGHALEAYYTARNGQYVSASTLWINTLTTSGELSTVPSLIAYSISGVTGCSTAAQNSWCYNVASGATSDAIVYAELESNVEKSKCGTPPTTRAFFVFSTDDGRGGLVCLTSGEPTVGTQTWNPTQ